jgi:hypothetical protein
MKIDSKKQEKANVWHVAFEDAVKDVGLSMLETYLSKHPEIYTMPQAQQLEAIEPVMKLIRKTAKIMHYIWAPYVSTKELHIRRSPEFSIDELHKKIEILVGKTAMSKLSLTPRERNGLNR